MDAVATDYRSVIEAQLGPNPRSQAYVAVCGRDQVVEAGRALATKWLCEHRTACGECEACLKTLRGDHSGLQVIEPDGASVKIKQVREMQDQTSQRDLTGGMKIVVVQEADRLGPEAANAFLKTLEEPQPHLVFLLVTARPALLLTTILSRCQLVRFPTAGLQEAETGIVKKGEALLVVLDEIRPGVFDPMLAYLRKHKSKWDREETADMATWLLQAYRERWRKGDKMAVRLIPHVEWMLAQLSKNVHVGLCVEGLGLRIMKERK